MGDGKQDFSIGKLSKHTGCNVETIRYYEKAGLLPAPPRTAGGHRIYGGDHARRLGFIRRSRELGFSLDEIHHLQGVKDKIRDLRKLQRTLTTISNECEGGIAPSCPIIEALYSRHP
jgi:MerR family mercuric resistance operon transcriptional regulator